MTYPCGIIRDLLPLYMDDICNDESKQAVEKHLLECEKCRNCYEVMKSTDNFLEKKIDNGEDIKMVNSLKNIKLKMNQKIRNITLCAMVTVVAFIVGFNLLFHAAIKEVSLDDISISADVYSLAELIENPPEAVPNSESVTIFSDKDDKSNTIEVKIPELGKIMLTEDTIKKCKYATVISIHSEYFLRTIKHESKDDTIYITAFKTTLLDNKAENYQKTMNILELKEINRIVFIDKNGIETELWRR